MKLGGAPLEAAKTYRVVATSFLADGGDGFTTFESAMHKVTGGLDIDALTAYLAAHDPYAPVTEARIVKR